MGEELSLVIEQPLEKETERQIQWNKKEFISAVSSITEQYSGLTYTEEQMKEAKKDRAKLNAMLNAISDRRIEVKKVFMEPIKVFESEVEEVVELIKEPIAMIDKQIREYEDRTKKEKKHSLEEYFKEISADLKEYIKFEQIFDKSWLNKSTSLSKAKKEIEQRISKVKMDIHTIEVMCEEKYHPLLKDHYLRCLNITATMSECSRLRELDRREAERKEREAEMARLKAERETNERKLQEDNVAKTVENVSEPVESASKQPESVSSSEENVSKREECVQESSEEIVAPPMGNATVTDPFASQEDTKQYKTSFTVFGTKAQIMAVKQFMIDNKIKFGKVEK